MSIRKDVHDPAWVPQIIGIEAPFRKINETARKLLEGNIAFDGSRKALEACASMAAVQEKAGGTYAGHPEIEIELIKSAFAKESPVLTDERLSVPRNKFIGLLQELLEALGVAEGELINITDKIVELTGGEKNLIIPISAFTQEILIWVAEASAPDANTIKAAIDATWQVFAADMAADIHARLKDERWTLPVCPICGSHPDMGRISAEEGHLYLSCPLCITEWKYPRLKCPWCGNEDQKLLGYFTAEEYPGYRVSICSNCHGYIKLATEVTLGREYVPVVDNLLTLELDLQAGNEGFHRPV